MQLFESGTFVDHQEALSSSMHPDRFFFISFAATAAAAATQKKGTVDHHVPVAVVQFPTTAVMTTSTAPPPIMADAIAAGKYLKITATGDTAQDAKALQAAMEVMRANVYFRSDF